MLFKAAQKFQVGNYGLAFSYDFSTKVTTGILHGTGVTRWKRDYDIWQMHAAAEIFENIKAMRSLWTHPLFMPATLLQHHICRLDYYCTVVLDGQLTKVQTQLGTTRAGRLAGTRGNLATDLPIQRAKVNLKELTVAMSSFVYEAIWFCGVSEWQISCLRLLGDVLIELKDIKTEPTKHALMAARIRFLTSSAEGIKKHNNALRENGQADMGVVSDAALGKRLPVLT